MTLEIQIRRLARVNIAINLINELLLSEQAAESKIVVAAPLALLLQSRDTIIKDLDQRVAMDKQPDIYIARRAADRYRPAM